MFLRSTRVRLLQRITRPETDSGSTIVLVIAVVMILSLGVLVIGASTVSALSTTATTRSNVQSQAAADGGAAWARAEIARDFTSCRTTMTPPASINSTVKVQSTSAASLTSGVVWSDRCPVVGDTFMRILSTGTASNGNVMNTAGTQSHAEIIISGSVTQTAAPSSTSGSAIYVAGGGFSNSSTVLTGTPGAKSDIRVLAGDFTCTSGGTYDGNITIESGSVHITNPCTINGDLWVSGSVRIDSGATVNGNITAAGGEVYLNGAGKVTGNVYANGKFTLNNGFQIGGNAEATGESYIGNSAKIGGSATFRYLRETSGTFTVGGSLTSTAYQAHANGEENHGSYLTTIDPAIKVAGNLALGGSLKTWGSVCAWDEPGYACGLESSGAVGGSVSIHQAGLVSPSAKAAPDVPNWVDVAFVPGDWSNAGWEIYTLTGKSGSCNFWSPATSGDAIFNNLWTKLTTATSPVVFDVRTCSTFEFNANDITLKTDVAFIGNRFKTNNIKVASDSSTNRKFSLIVPDNTKNSQPTGSNCDVELAGSPGITMSAQVYGMLYTPCAATFPTQTIWRGQIYSNVLKFSGSDGLIYYPIGIPGIDLDTGERQNSDGGSIVSGSFTTLVSSRDRTTAG